MSQSRPSSATSQPIVIRHLFKAKRVNQTASIFKQIGPVFPALVLNLKNPDLASFASTSLFANHLAKPTLNQKALRELFGYVREGNITQVEKMLKASPHLALLKWKASNEKEKIIANMGGQHIDVEGKTGYQFALGEEDNEMATIFKEAILKVSDEEEAKEQYRAQFPNGWEREEEKKWQPIFAILNILTEVIRCALEADIISSGDPNYTLTMNPTSDVAMALRHLQELLHTRLNNPVTIGRHYNPGPLLHIFKKYNAHYKNYFGNDRENPRAMLYWRLAGHLQAPMPASYAQLFCAPGLYGNVEQIKKGKPQNRSFKFWTHDIKTNSWIDMPFYPISAHGLGDNFAIGACATSAKHASEAIVAKPFLMLCELKTTASKNLYNTTTLEVPHQKRRRLDR